MNEFSVKVINYQSNTLLNICDADLLGKTIKGENNSMHIGQYYQERIVDESEASRLILESHVINMVGENTVSLSLKLEIGAKSTVKRIAGIPFLLIFKT